MKSRPSLVTCSLILAALILGSVLICGLTRNIFSPPTKPVAMCQMPSNDAIVRLYVFEGSSVTTSPTYSITYEEPKDKEKMIFGAYSSPGVRDIRCEQEQVVLLMYPLDSDDTIILPLDWVKDELIYKPIQFEYSRLLTHEYSDRVANWKGITP